MNILLIIISIIIAIPIIVFALEIIFALLPLRKTVISKSASRPSITVLVPAHNESVTIQATLSNIKEQLKEQDRLVVVADNCNDDTADIAKAKGAEVVERYDAEKRGKGYALDCGIRYIEKNPTQIVIIMDADCIMDAGGLEAIATLSAVKNKPVQALYLMKYKAPSIKQRISEFAWQVKNYVRPRGLYNIGMPCQLMGTGMAFPWDIIVNTQLATSNIVEDMKMGMEMAVAGHAPIFCPEVCVTSTFPETSSAEQSQKKRWEHGHLSMMLSIIPRSILNILKYRSLKLVVMILDIIVPPLALLSLLAGIVFISTLSSLLITESILPFLISVISTLIFILAVLFAWVGWGRHIVSFSDLLKIPFYILGKIPLYISYLFKKQKEWIRTDRD